MPGIRFLVRLHRRLAARRRLLFAATLALLALLAASLTALDVREDIEAMLPGGDSNVAADFRLLQSAPFAHKVMITLTAGPGLPPERLAAAVDAFAAGLTPPLFTRATTGPDTDAGPAFLEGMVRLLPSLASAEDVEAMRRSLEPGAVKQAMRRNLGLLAGPEGFALKNVIVLDPLGWRELALAKLAALNVAEGVRVSGGRFLSRDGNSALILAEAVVPITDASGSERVLARLDELAGELPEGVTASVVSGHAYTLANARAIKRDLALILTVSTLAIAAIFAVFLRTRQALWVFALPLVVMLAGTAAAALTFDAVSGITLGFGGVLLGISVDFALHVFFGLRKPGMDPAERLGAVARPVLLGGLTTLAAFGVLAFSSLPGQRQLAVFALGGLSASLAVCLIVLPHLIRDSGRTTPGPSPFASGLFSEPRRASRRLVLPLWIVLMLLAAIPAAGVGVSGDLRELALVPDGILEAEDVVRETWGNARGRAMVFVSGSDRDNALAANQRLFRELRRRFPDAPVASLAPLLPSERDQRASRERMDRFWKANGAAIRARIEAEARVLGFRDGAFTPFFTLMETGGTPATPQALDSLGLGELYRMLAAESATGPRYITLVPDSPELAAFFDPETEARLDARYVSQTRFRDEAGEELRRDFVRFAALAALAVIGLLTLIFRGPRRVLAALAPPATGLVCLAGVMGLSGLNFTMYSMAASILVLGLGVDYGIFMVERTVSGTDNDTERAVLVSGLTTMAGFGALVLARHPALWTMGFTVLTGLAAAVPTALFVVPALTRGRSA